MQRLTITSCATAVPMGAEVYQEQIAGRALAALATDAGDEEGWILDRRVVRSLRSPLPGTHRLPMGWLKRASSTSRRGLGHVLYPRDTVVHRMNLELPPSPYADVVTLHDVVAWRFADESDPVRAAAAELRRAAAVICVSSFTAGEAQELLGLENLHVVHNGVDAQLLRRRARDDRRAGRARSHVPLRPGCRRGLLPQEPGRPRAGLATDP